MAVIVELKSRFRDAGRRGELRIRQPFKLLFFTGVRYERMAEDHTGLQACETKNQRRATRRTQERLKA